MTNKLRKDYILDRWVVIASQRRRRPSDFIERRNEEKKQITCPFCPGNEHLTPPASLVYLLEDDMVRKDRDEDGIRHNNWIIRCIPNLYPAFSPPGKRGTTAVLQERCKYVCLEALGYHEVLIESPDHDEQPSNARLNQLFHVINALRDRVSFFMAKDYVKYISIFRNHGASAGASLSHAHMQIIAMPMIPKIVKEEEEASRRYYKDNGRCVFCDIMREEEKSERFIWGNGDFIVFAPWASINPFEFWIFPKRHSLLITDLSEDKIKRLAEVLRISLGGLRRLLNDPPYNLGFHMLPEEHYHWHIEVYPRLAIWAGFEKSTGTYINVMPPEEAAENLRESLEKENEILKTG